MKTIKNYLITLVVFWNINSEKILGFSFFVTLMSLFLQILVLTLTNGNYRMESLMITIFIVSLLMSFGSDYRPKNKSCRLSREIKFMIISFPLSLISSMILILAYNMK